MRFLLAGLLNLFAIGVVVVLVFVMFDRRTPWYLIPVFGVLAAGIASASIIGGERMRGRGNWDG